MLKCVAQVNYIILNVQIAVGLNENAGNASMVMISSVHESGKVLLKRMKLKYYKKCLALN